MTTPAVRKPIPGQKQIVRSCIVAIGVCAAWHFAIRPIERGLSTARAEFDSVTTQLNDFEQSSGAGPDLGMLITSLSAEAAAANLWTAKSGDAAKLYDQFRALASDNGVRIARLEPSPTRNTPLGHGGVLNDLASKAEVFGYSIEVTGTYQSVSRFVDACERSLGATKVVTFHVAPVVNSVSSVTGEPNVSATIETSHLKLTIPDLSGQANAESAPKFAERGS